MKFSKRMQERYMLKNLNQIYEEDGVLKYQIKYDKYEVIE